MRKLFNYTIIICLSVLPFTCLAQTDSVNFQQSYQQFKEQAFEEFYDFKANAFNEFEQFLSEAWTLYQNFSEISGAYSDKKPEAIPTLPVSTGVIDVDAPSIENAIPLFENPSDEKNAIIDGSSSQNNVVSITYYGRPLKFIVPMELRIKADGTKERHIAKYHEAMRESNTSTILNKQLDDAVNLMGLNEWGYFSLLRAISEKIFSNANDRVLFSFFMLHSHGFKARVGRSKDSQQLLLLLAIDNSKEVYSKTFFRIKGTKFYVVYGNGKKGESVYSYDENADDSGLKEIGLDFTKTLNIASCDMSRTLHIGKVDQDIELPYSTSHLRYYDEIPTTVFPIYFNTPVSYEAEQALAQTFSTLGKRYNKVQMVDIMLNFVQTAFAYKIDEQQFGREKYFFPEEVIGYPFSDCEDRSALFAWLVRRFVGYDVIGVLYDDHLATAVCFGNDAQLQGKSVDFNGKRYIVCDPTYSNASIGTVMPKFVNAKYEIVKIN